MKNFKTAEEFYSFCVMHKACQPGLDEIRGKTIADWWDMTERGDWMEWLLGNGVWECTPTQWQEYQRVDSQAWTEFERVDSQAWTEFEREKARMEIERARARREYKRAKARREYKRVTAVAIREIIGNPFRQGA